MRYTERQGWKTKMGLNNEQRFDIDRDVGERFNKLVEETQRRKSDLARTLFLLGLETFEIGLASGKTPIYIPLNQSPMLRVKFEGKNERR